MWDCNGGVYLGYATDRTEGEPPASAPVIQYVGDRHLMSIGPAGSGIARRLLQPNVLALRDWSMVVVDPGGELAALCAHQRDPEMAHTIVLNPFGVNGLPSHGCNPIAALDAASLEFPDDALDLAEALIRPDGIAPTVAASAQDLLTALILYSRLTRADGGGLPHVRHCLGQPPEAFRALVERMISAGDGLDWPELSLKATRFAAIEPGNRELNSILSCALTQTRWLDSRPMQADLGMEPMDFARLKEQPTAVFLVLPPRRLGTHAAWLRVVLTGIIQTLMRASGAPAGAPTVPVMLLLNDYAALARGGFPAIDGNLARFAGCGIKLWTVWHDLAQVRTLYGDGFESFVGASGVLQAFAPQDMVTAEYLSQRSGLTAYELEAQSRTVAVNPGTSISQSQAATTSYHAVPRMLPQDLRNMQDGFSVIFSHKVRNTIRAYMPLPGTQPARRRSFLRLHR
jgi:type IV secretion system protein VirD4